MIQCDVNSPRERRISGGGPVSQRDIKLTHSLIREFNYNEKRGMATPQALCVFIYIYVVPLLGIYIVY